MKTGFLTLSGLLRLLRLYLYWVVVFVLQKPLFMLLYRGLYDKEGIAGIASVMWHGLPLDLSMAGYVCMIPAVLLLIGVWTGRHFRSFLRKMTIGWLAVCSSVVSMSFLLNAVLYEYWAFPLDSTPLFYFFSSPKDAVASVSVAMVLLAIAFAIAITIVLFWGAVVAWGRKEQAKHGRIQNLRSKIHLTIGILVVIAVFFIAMRGGVTVSAMNTGRVYFSQKPSLNHAAVNPLFSLMESLAHQKDFASQYRFMEPQQADALFADMTRPGAGHNEVLLNAKRPDIYLIILESFSSQLMSVLGGRADVAVNLDSLSHEGILFTKFYANSFRTDRGLVSLLSGYPAQPTMSLMKYPRKTASLPSIAQTLWQNGYETAYYYGGDADFTNMRSYLMSQRYETIVSDKDFPVRDRLSKWGVPDHLVFQRLLADMRQKDAGNEKERHPRFYVLQTSSSHEPFDVPYHRLKDKCLNAFAYTDDCVGSFVKSLRESSRWNNTLIILVPDHLGAWPREISNFDFNRYEIPMIWLGGVVAAPKHVDTFGSQQDLAATLLAQLGVDHSQFLFSKDMLDTTAQHYAFFTVPDAFGMATSSGRYIFDNKLCKMVASEGSPSDSMLLQGKAYLQKLYDDIGTR